MSYLHLVFGRHDCMIVSAISSEIPLSLYNFLTRHAIKATFGKVGIVFLLYGKYKDVLDFRSNNGSCIRSLRSRVNRDWVVNRGAISTPVAISASIFDKTLDIMANGGNA